MVTSQEKPKLGPEGLVTDLSVERLVEQGEATLKKGGAKLVTNSDRQWGKPFLRTIKVKNHSYYQLCQHGSDGKLVVIKHLHTAKDGKISA